MKKKCSSKQCCDNAYSARTGVLFGFAIAALHVVYHAVRNQIPESVYAHILAEMSAYVLGGAALFAAGSAICNWFSRTA
jgi:hypothetical protein